MQRVKDRGETDRFEEEQLSFFHRIREAYHRLARENPERYFIIDTLPANDIVKEKLIKVLEQLTDNA